MLGPGEARARTYRVLKCEGILVLEPGTGPSPTPGAGPPPRPAAHITLPDRTLLYSCIPAYQEGGGREGGGTVTKVNNPYSTRCATSPCGIRFPMCAARRYIYHNVNKNALDPELQLDAYVQLYFHDQLRKWTGWYFMTRNDLSS